MLLKGPGRRTPISSVRFVTQSWPALCDSMDCSTPGLPVHRQFPKFTQTHVRWLPYWWLWFCCDLHYIVYMEATADGFSKIRNQTLKKNLYFPSPGSVASPGHSLKPRLYGRHRECQRATRQSGARCPWEAGGGGGHGSPPKKRSNVSIVDQPWKCNCEGRLPEQQILPPIPLPHHLNYTFCSSTLTLCSHLLPALWEPPPRWVCCPHLPWVTTNVCITI